MTYPKDIKITAPEQFALLTGILIFSIRPSFASWDSSSKPRSRRFYKQNLILAIDVAHIETEATVWGFVLETLESDWVKGSAFGSISDHQEGLQNAIKRHFQGASWQHCQTHFHRNVKGITPPKYQREVAQALKDVFNAPDQACAQERLSAMMDTYEEILPNVVRR